MSQIFDQKAASTLMLVFNDVVRETTLSPATLKRLIKDGGFPLPVKLTEKRLAWRRVDVEAWIASRAEAA